MAWWVSLSKQRCLVMASPKAEDYAEFGGAASALHPPVRDPETFARLLAWLESELARRSANPSERQPLVIVIDEVNVWISKVDRTDTVLEEISNTGRALNMHLVLGSQRADEASVGRAAFNMTCRIVGKVGSGVFKFGTAGVAGADLESLLGKGDVLMVTPAMRRFQVPVLEPGDWQRIAGQPGAIAFPEAKPVERKPPSAARATDVDENLVMDAFRSGISRREAMTKFKIGHDRAKRLELLAMAEK
jgi:DNA segregation ATPase FtsK/SpoIIIE-like protein